jgi:hypothetical protein
MEVTKKALKELQEETSIIIQSLIDRCREEYSSSKRAASYAVILALWNVITN